MISRILTKYPLTFLAVATLILLVAAFLRIADLRNPELGLHYDEAADLLLTRDIALYSASPFPVVSAYSGREALFYYLAAPLTRVIGADPFATRLTSAFLGLLTVAVTIALGKALFRGHTHRRQIALLAGAWIAVNGAQIWLSRQGFRTSPQPLLIGLSLWALFVALNRMPGRWLLPMIAAGVFGGGALYVYIAARVYPFWWVLAFVISLILAGRTERLRLRRMLVGIFALAATAIPLLLYFARNPAIFLDRLSQVAPGDGTISLVDSAVAHLKMFFTQGEPILRYNFYVGRPFLDVISGGLMVIGIAVLLVTLRQRPKADEIVPVTRRVWLLLAPLLIAPSVIAVGGFPPNHMRSVTMVPLIFILPALGLTWLAARIGSRPLRVGLMVAVFMFFGANSWIDYRAWVANPERYYQSDGDLDAAAAMLARTVAPDDLIYLWSVYYEHPTVLAHPLEYTHIRWMMREQLFIAPPGRRAWYVLPRSVRPEPGLLTRLTAAGAIRVETPPGMDGQPDYMLWQLAPETPRPSLKTDSSFGDFLKIGGASAESRLNGDRRDLVVYGQWGVIAAPPFGDYQPGFTLSDACGNRIASQVTLFMDHTDQWRAGEVIFTAASFPITRGEAADTVHAQAIWSRRDAPNQYAPVLNARRFQGIRAAILDATLPPDPARTVPPSVASQVAPFLFVSDPPKLPAQIDQGESLTFMLDWTIGREPTPARTIQVTLDQETTGQKRVLYQGNAACNTVRLSALEPGQTLRDRYAVPIPPDLPPGRWRVQVMVEGGERPALSQTVEVRAVARQFTPPTLATHSEAVFGESIKLVGYSIRQDGGKVMVELGWKALAAPDLDYTAFVHLTTLDGAIFSQRDAQPIRPTRLWLTGEYFVERYELSAPAGAYRIQVGWYQLESGGRLTVRGDGDALTIFAQEVNN